MEDVRKHRGIKLVTTEKIRNYMVCERNYYMIKLLSKNLILIEMS